MDNVEKKDNTNLVKETKEKIQVISEGTTLFERLLAISKKYSFWDILKTLFISILVVYMSFLFMNPSYIFEKYTKLMEDKHKVELSERFAQSRVVSNELSLMLNKTNADRVFFIEYHNSVKSLQGAPFAFGSMDFEEVAEGVDFIGDEYTNFSLTKYKFVSYINEHLIFFGPVENIEEIDRRLYLKLLSNDIQYIALIEVEGTEHPLGILGFSWTIDNFDDAAKKENEIKKELRSGALKLALTLDNKKENCK